ncbi:MAG: FecR domain-containing protein [Proteiniphilum sp.]|uniref:FecR family protein n=1 Tax=Proteiniphilum sp. TaxID=1926877 RepID=UPI002B1FA3FC|nr:FecR domain-containing protein [Proteiniphilum sp.]MEA5062161.1 FecR domain-containing protein [Petrimonas sp.]MEA5128922.1 FecR domain-containing protein [Proteiniphilum sp.]
MNQRDFLCDDLFVYWRIHPTRELNAFWESYLRENEDIRIPFNEAIETFEMIRNGKEILQNDDTSILHELKDKIEKGKRKKLRKLLTSSVAAILLIMLIPTFFILYKNSESVEPGKSSIGEVMSTNHIQLFTGGDILEIDNNSTLDLSGKKHTALIQNPLTRKEIDLKDHQTNKLIVPYGKRSILILADGSKVHLNSGTKMEFPSMFTEKKREIHVEGEIFIEVTKQNNTPFVIYTPHSQITVHGTSFNVSSYSEDPKEAVVLVNGLVEVKSENSVLQLQPNEMAEIENGVILHKQVDVSDYIGWTSGYLQLNRVPLNEVLKKIGRYYNVEFQYDPAIDLYDQTCSGKLFLSENIHDVLEAFSKMTYLQYNKQSDDIIFIHS